MSSLEGRIALVTGAAQGIGAAIAVGLVRQGASVLMTDIDASGAQATAAVIDAEAGIGGAAAVRTLS